MAVAFRSAATTVTTGAGANACPTIAKPAGLADGDLVVVILACGQTGGTYNTGTFNTPTGWTYVDHDESVWGAHYLAVFARKVPSAGSEPTWNGWTFTNAGATEQAWSCVALAFSGAADPADVAIAKAQTSPASTTHTTPSVTVADDDSTVLAVVVGERDGSYTWSTLTERSDASGTGVSSAVRVTTTTATIDQNAGTYNPSDPTYSQSRRAMAATLAIPPAAAPSASPLHVWDGAAWADASANVWDGSAWVAATVS
ncbi:MAG TPA: hypothetical protein VGE43_19465 [Acidimicrobiales bacterium]